MESLATRFEQWLQTYDSEEDPARPAATVVCLRLNKATNTPQVLLVRRNTKGAFANHWVFPGGKVDDQDNNPALLEALSDSQEPHDLLTSRIAAVRETSEEVGLNLAPQDLLVFSHWLPPKKLRKRFATWFFAVWLEEPEITIDDFEITEYRWCDPGAVLGDMHQSDGYDSVAAHSGTLRKDKSATPSSQPNAEEPNPETTRAESLGVEKMDIAPPTWRTLHEIASNAEKLDSPESFALWMSQREAPFFVTRPKRDKETGASMMVWHGDEAWPETPSEKMHGPAGSRNRLWLNADSWRLEETRDKSPKGA